MIDIAIVYSTDKALCSKTPNTFFPTPPARIRYAIGNSWVVLVEMNEEYGPLLVIEWDLIQPDWQVTAPNGFESYHVPSLFLEDGRAAFTLYDALSVQIEGGPTLNFEAAHVGPFSYEDRQRDLLMGQQQGFSRDTRPRGFS